MSLQAASFVARQSPVMGDCFVFSSRNDVIAHGDKRVQLWVESLDLTEAGFSQGLRRERSILHLSQGFMNGK